MAGFFFVYGEFLKGTYKGRIPLLLKGNIEKMEEKTWEKFCWS